MTTKVTENEIIITKETRYPKFIEFSDIVDACEVKQDDMYHETPWESCEGFEHESIDLDHVENCQDNVDRLCRLPTRRNDVGITLIKSWAYDYARERGASKQTAREYEARKNKGTLDTLENWYKNGWEWWMITCDFMGVTECVGGFDDYEYCENYGKEEIAEELAYILEKRGHIINYPKTKKPKKTTRKSQLNWLTN